MMRLWRWLFPKKYRLRIFLKSGQNFDITVRDATFKSDGDEVVGWEMTWWNHERILRLPPGNIECVLQL